MKKPYILQLTMCGELKFSGSQQKIDWILTGTIKNRVASLAMRAIGKGNL